MMLRIFALLDTKVSAFSTPFFVSHVGHAVRAVSDLGQDLSTTVGRHPADFMLFELGTFDDQSGVIDRHDRPISHGPVLAFIPQQRQAELLDVLPQQGPPVTVQKSAANGFNGQDTYDM